MTDPKVPELPKLPPPKPDPYASVRKLDQARHDALLYPPPKK